MDRPRLVPLEPRPVTFDDGSPGYVLQDREGVVPAKSGLSPAAWWLAAHFDGSRTCADVAEAAREAGLPVETSVVERLAADLKRAGFVRGPEHDRLRAAALAAWRAQPLRPPSCAGGVYPDDPAALRRALDAWFALDTREGPSPRPSPREAGRGGTGSDGRAPTLIVSPHIDYPRGAAGYAHAARAAARADADVFVIFGTAHASPSRLFTLTRLDLGTPLGPVRTDRAVVDALASALGEDEVLGDELCHKDEHSVELQVVLLAHAVRRPFTVVPVLCSTISHLPDPGPATAPFLGALAAALAGRRACFVAGADLAHVGPMYGDERPPTPAELQGFAAADRRTLGFLEAGDAAGFHRDGIVDDERRRLCGVAPIYAALKASGARARLLHYGQWSDGTDSVSFAAAAG